MRVCLFTRSLNVGGAERQLAVLAEDLLAAGHDVRVLTFYEGGRIQEELRAKGVSCTTLDKRGRWDALPFLFRLVRELRRMQPDVIYSMLQTANVLAALLRPLLPGIAVVWGIRYADLRFAFYGRLHAVSVWLERQLSRRADAIITNSRAGMEYCVRQGYRREKLVSIENAIDTDRFRPSRELRERERARWGVEADVPVMGMVARFDPVKRHDLFLEAAVRIVADAPSVKIVLAGNCGAQLAALHGAVRQRELRESVIVLGDRSDIEAVYNGLDVLCSPSASEGFSNTIAEAMASGTFCVVSDVGDSARIVGEHGIVVVEPGAQALTRALGQALGRLEVERRVLHDSIRERFSRPRSFERTIGVFETALRSLGKEPQSPCRRADATEAGRIDA